MVTKFTDKGEKVVRYAMNQRALKTDAFLYGHLIKCPGCDELSPLNEESNVFICEYCLYEETR